MPKGTRSAAAKQMLEEDEPQDDSPEDIDPDVSDDENVKAMYTDDGSSAQGAKAMKDAFRNISLGL